MGNKLAKREGGLIHEPVIEVDENATFFVEYKYPDGRGQGSMNCRESTIGNTGNGPNISAMLWRVAELGGWCRLVVGNTYTGAKEYTDKAVELTSEQMLHFTANPEEPILFGKKQRHEQTQTPKQVASKPLQEDKQS